MSEFSRSCIRSGDKDGFFQILDLFEKKAKKILFGVVVFENKIRVMWRKEIFTRNLEENRRRTERELLPP
jgi:hypothetical protein